MSLAVQSDPILTADEVATELRCSKTHVYNLMHGEVPGIPVLPHLNLGRKKVVKRSAFEFWKERVTVDKLPDPGMNAVNAAQ